MTEAQKELLFKLVDIVRELVPHQHDDTAQGDTARAMVSELHDLAHVVDMEDRPDAVDAKISFRHGGLVTRNGLSVGRWGHDGGLYWFTRNRDAHTTYAERRSQLLPAVVMS
jgi:hypothetical protein